MPARVFSRSYAGMVLAVLVLVGLPVWLALRLQPIPPGLQFSPAAFSSLPGWRSADLTAARLAVTESCGRILDWPDDRPLPGALVSGIGGRVRDWREACLAIVSAPDGNDALRQAFERYFRPYAVSRAGSHTGLFTGYYEAFLDGSFERGGPYQVPLYGRPGDLISVNLGDFRTDLKGRRIAGRLNGTRLVPYDDRRAIRDGALAGRDLELVWVDDPVDAFFLHIQGSGRVRLPDGRIVRVGYAGQNGHAYRGIGRLLVDRGEIPPDALSMQTIRAWLRDNGDKAEALMAENASFVFFHMPRPQEGAAPPAGPYGSAGVPLTAGHSLAVDRRHLPLHVPLWLDTSHPDPDDRAAPPVPMRRLMVAQDTGGAIRGEIRGDVFWGFGDRAEEIAGRMANRGRYWLLLPARLDPSAPDTAQSGP